jgi:hypothetical protein
MSYDHVLKVLEKEERLEIYRLFADGRKEFYTAINVRDIEVARDKDQLSVLAKLIGEALLIDSPAARAFLKL